MGNRPFHQLKGNRGESRPSHVIFFDTETAPISISSSENRQVLQLGWLCYHRTSEPGHNRNDVWIKFDSPEAFWVEVERHIKPQRRVYLVGHNVAFDFRIVNGFKYALDHGWEEKFVYDKGLTTIMRYRHNQCSIEIISTTNFFTMTLKDLGKLVNLPKLDVEFGNVSRSDLSRYCKRDVEIVVAAWGLWLDFLDKHNFGGFRRTLPSQAFSAYRHRFMTTPIMIHGNMEVCALERKGYRGGRTEVFRVGQFPKASYYYVDVNGMYAFAMKNNKYPYKLCGEKARFTIGGLRNKLRNFAVIAEVSLLTDEPAFVHKYDGRNIYPTGTFETTLTTPELKYALQRGMINEVNHIAWYKQSLILEYGASGHIDVDPCLCLIARSPLEHARFA